MTSHDRAGISRERGSHPRWQQQKQRPLLDLPARLLQCCEVHEYIFSIITSGVICVLKLCYALRQTHILMTCTCNCSMHISAHAALLHAHFTTCNCSMHIQHLHVLAQARPTMSCIPLVIEHQVPCMNIPDAVPGTVLRGTDIVPPVRTSITLMHTETTSSASFTVYMTGSNPTRITARNDIVQVCTGPQ